MSKVSSDRSVMYKYIMCLQKVILEAAKDFVSFVNHSPSPYHGRYRGGNKLLEQEHSTNSLGA